MRDNRLMSAPSGFRIQLVETPSEAVPVETASRFVDMCAGAEAVEAGFACFQRRAFDGAPHDERLVLGVLLRRGSRSSDEQSRVVAVFSQAFPGQGLSFLEEVAVPAWRKSGVQLY